MKFGRPLDILPITQTYHTNSSNTAVDFSAAAKKPVYAIADGRLAFWSPYLGSYCIQEIENSILKAYYVHIHRCKPVGTMVKKGEIIGYIAPSSLNGGHPTHLHLGLTKGYYLMNYIDRRLTFRAGFILGSKDNLEIRNAWFGGGFKLNWNLHKDLSYTNNTMTIKIGDKVKLSADTRLRVGSGLKYSVKTVCKKGAVGTLIGGMREFDGYQWGDVKFLNDQGWMANVSNTRLIKTTKTVTNTDGTIPPVEPPEDTELQVCQSDVLLLREENDALKAQLAEQKILVTAEEKKLKLEKEINAENVKEMEDLQKRYDVLYVEKNRIENERNQCIKELHECGDLSGASAGEMIAELWRRFKNSLDRSE